MLLASCALIPSTQPTDVQSTAVRKVETGSPEVAAITFKRSGGFAGKTEQWSFYSDGRVVSDQGTTQLLPVDISGLVAGLTALGIYDLKNSYGGLTNCNDCVTYTISISGEGKTKTITTTDGATDTPAELGKIMQLINDVINKIPTQ